VTSGATGDYLSNELREVWIRVEALHGFFALAPVGDRVHHLKSAAGKAVDRDGVFALDAAEFASGKESQKETPVRRRRGR